MKTKLLALAGAILATSLTFGLFMIPIKADAQTTGDYYESKDQLTGQLRAVRYSATDTQSLVRISISSIKKSQKLSIWVSRSQTIADCKRLPIRIKATNGQVYTLSAKEFELRYCEVEVTPEMITGKVLVEFPSYNGQNYIGNYDLTDLDLTKLFILQ